MDKKLISIIIPAYNEEDCVDALYNGLTEVINKITKYDFEVIIVENGSYDDTFAKLLAIHKKDPRFKIIKLTRNCEVDCGVTAGLKFAKGDAAIITYADLEDPPHLFYQFIEKWEEGYKHVYGITNARQGSFLRKLNSKIFYYIINKLTKNVIPKNVADFRLVDQQVYREINHIAEKNRFLRGLFSWLNYDSIGINYDRNSKRAGGKSKAHTLLALSVAFKGIFSYSNFPLRIASIIGAATSMMSFCGIIYLVAQFMLFHNFPFKGFGTIICTILLLFGILFLLIGILGEYIALIYTEVKGRPLYIVDKVVGFNDKKDHDLT
jgi:glycosyltransferase involved in cell wall biosynthesis